ncbi:PaaI family thioesterase [Allosphingosinicella vermicomposti]|uniref:PaaI family thioesterase n=1 Tax=Allosphingosinicella vermicomposti TaxID=614671 RepID=UPI000D0EEC92|nr:PaaI family thioesterase [Allosphingosinicella vermicomposti]
MLDRLPPYARLLDLRTERDADTLLWIMPFAAPVVGRPGYLHGGAIAGLLEFAALGTLYDQMGETRVEAKPINVNVNFMRGGIDHDTFAAATITRLGTRVASVEAQAWQKDRAKPIASAHMTLLLKR